MPKGSKGEKRPADVIGAAVMVGRIATGVFHAGASHHELDSQKTNIMLNHYNGKLRAYLKAHGAMETRSFTSISGSDIIDKFGYGECK